MSNHGPRPDPSFERLRRAHRAERAPAELRARALERLRSLPSPVGAASPPARGWRCESWGLGLAAILACGVWLGVTHLAVEPPSAAGRAASPADVVPSAEPLPPAAGRCAEPLRHFPWEREYVSPAARISGLVAEVFETRTECGPLARRYLLRVPAGAAAAAPVLMVLHDAGQSADLVQIPTRWWFDELGQREGAVLVYADASLGASGGGEMGGAWQTDEGVHPAVDDFAYLEGIVDDLRRRRGLGSGEVFLAGVGSGGEMALAAALRGPELYSGVSAFLPAEPVRAEGYGAPARQARAARRLSSVFVVLPAAPGGVAEGPSAAAASWAEALGGDSTTLRVTLDALGIARVEARLPDGAALRVLELPAEVDPFPLPGGGDPNARAASAARPFFLDGPGAAWAFFQRQRP